MAPGLLAGVRSGVEYLPAFGQMPAPSSLTQKITHTDPSLKVQTAQSGDFDAVIPAVERAYELAPANTEVTFWHGAMLNLFGGEGGSPLFIFSVLLAGLVQMPSFMAIYATAKAAVIALTEAIRDDLARDSIGASVLCPGPIKSRILWEQMLGRGTRKCVDINKTHFTIFDCFDGTQILLRRRIRHGNLRAEMNGCVPRRDAGDRSVT